VNVVSGTYVCTSGAHLKSLHSHSQHHNSGWEAHNGRFHSGTLTDGTQAWRSQPARRSGRRTPEPPSSPARPGKVSVSVRGSEQHWYELFKNTYLLLFLGIMLPTQCMFLPPTYYPTNIHSDTTHVTYKNSYMFRHHLTVPSSGNNYNKVVQPNLPIYVMFILINLIKTWDY